MQLDTARLCLDCNEIHDQERCLACGSEAFAYLTRWVPTVDTQPRTRPTTSPEADVYRELIGAAESSARRGALRRGALGVTVVALAGWLWRRGADRRSTDTSGTDKP
jgi:hypothetical protein